MRMNLLIKITLFFAILILAGCTDSQRQSFGFQIIDDSDLPTVRIKEVNQENVTEPDFEIEYSATDHSGISKLELYGNGEIVLELDYKPQTIEWHYDGYEEIINFQLKAYDGFGKSAISDVYTIELNVLVFQVIDIGEINYITDMKIFYDDSLWLSATEHLYHYNESSFEEFDVPGEGVINDFFLAANGDFYVSRSSYDLHRLHNNEWSTITCDYGAFYNIVETADSSIYAKISGYYHKRIVKILDEGLEYVYIAPYATDFYQVGITGEGVLSYCDDEGLRTYENGEWELSYPGSDMRCFLFGENDEFFYYVSEYSNCMMKDGTPYQMLYYEIEDIAYDKERGLWLASGKALLYDNGIYYPFEENYTNLPDVDFLQVEVNSKGDVYYISNNYLMIFTGDLH